MIFCVTTWSYSTSARIDTFTTDDRGTSLRLRCDICRHSSSGIRTSSSSSVRWHERCFIMSFIGEITKRRARAEMRETRFPTSHVPRGANLAWEGVRPVFTVRIKIDSATMFPQFLPATRYPLSRVNERGTVPMIRYCT